MIFKGFLFLFFLNSTILYAQTALEYVHLGNVASRQENYKEAVLNYTKAIALDHHSKSAYYNRGYAYVELKKYKLAIEDLNMAIYIDIKYAPAYHVRGIAYYLKKKYPLALFNYGKAIELDPKNVKYHISRLGTYCKLGDNEDAWKEVITIQKLGGTVNPKIINLLKNKKYRDRAN